MGYFLSYVSCGQQKTKIKKQSCAYPTLLYLIQWEKVVLFRVWFILSDFDLLS